MHFADTLMIILLFSVTAASAGYCLWLWRAEYVHQRAVAFRVPSLYWPLARLGFSRNQIARRIFRVLFCEWYRKRFWNPLINSWLKVGSFNRRRHLSNCNIHAASSVMFWMLVVFFLYFAGRTAAISQFAVARRFCLWAAIALGIEAVFNLPAIVLSRYLYLLTLRRAGLNRPQREQRAPQTDAD